jgi:hypothetical protein
VYSAAQKDGFFESSEWWTVVDSFNITSLFRQGKLSQLANVDIDILLKEMPDLIEKGMVQQAIQLLPYIPNILLKLGKRGVLSIRLSPKTTNTSKGLRLHGLHADACVQHHPAIQPDQVVSVTGAV